ncbi:hypothetical protein ACRQ5Q_24555 [Bradyrhizobium sp. PMVTL-01]|uniref:hypothetical protein n=1 Tax=Bradyrhizobium sp. PMVTL-01 TaxID=3434999 RepID=UPI003F71B55D
MKINLHLEANSVGELHAQLREMLGSTAIATVTSPPIAPDQPEKTETTKRQTAAEKKAAEKAAKEAAEAAAAEAAAKTPEKVEEAKQDVKDEAAEQKAPEPMKLNHDHVRTMLGGYVQAYGMANAQADGADMIGFAKISEIPDDQAKLAAAVIGIATAIEKNPKNRDIEGDGITAEKIVQLKLIVDAAKAAK